METFRKVKEKHPDFMEHLNQKLNGKADEADGSQDNA